MNVLKLQLNFNRLLFDCFLLVTIIINKYSCNEIDTMCPRILHHVFDGYAPVGNTKAGNYTEYSNAITLWPCVEKCCEARSNCNTAFVFNKTCYHVKCTTNELCIPMKRNNVTTTLQMVLVNPVSEDDPTWFEILKSANFDDYRLNNNNNNNKMILNNNNNLLKLASFYETNKNANEKFDLSDAVYNVPYKNMNDVYGFETFSNSNNNDQYLNDDLMMDESKFFPETKMMACDVGTMCPPHEECKALVTKTQGICSCIVNYVRNNQGKCIRKSSISSESIAQKLMMNNINNYNGDMEDSILDSEKADSSDTPPAVKKLTVSVFSKDVRLPENEASLSAFVIPDENASGDKYNYLWSLISQPTGDTNGTMTDQTKESVKLSNLAEGLYRFKVAVTGNNGWYGEAFTNVTVSPEKRMNKPPEVVITPDEQTVKLPNSKAILDGSATKDDDHIITWHWELVQGPIGYQPTLPEISTLQLNDLSMPGNYSFKLTVTDSEKASNSTTATIQVLKEIDYPPTANAGQNVIVYLPKNNVTLNGSLSKDDHEIVAWEWTKHSSDQAKAVDMQNTRTPYLQLSNLEEGVYAFELKVTDAKNQSSTSVAHVFVKMPTNMPPVAHAGANFTINLPQTWAILNGSDSTDDIKISNYYWKQISGPVTAIIGNANASIANATSLTIGDYIFELAVVDEANNNASDHIKVTVIQEKNTPPVANGGGDQSVTLPSSAIILNGSRSYDDLGITNYSWTREPGSLAIGTVIANSDREPVLILTNIVAGRYVFKLTVNDGQGLSGFDTVSVIVHPDPLVLHLVELTLTMEATDLTQNEMTSLQQKLMLLMGDNTVKLYVRELKIEHRTGQIVIVFYVEKNNNKDKPEIMSALDVEKILKEKFWRDYSILGTSVSGIKTVICQNICSGHGVCNSETRACMCQSFWMPDIFYFWGVAEANCDWSILYVIIGVFIVFLLLSGICWGITCLCRKSSKPRTRTKTQKYALLGTHEEELPSFNRAGTTLSDSETDSDVLFESRSKQNGIPRTSANGEIRNGHKYTMTRLGRRIKT